MAKTVVGYEQYTFQETDYLSVETKDGWFYRFTRASENDPYRFEKRLDDDGMVTPGQNHHLPDAVANFLEDHPNIDAAAVHARPTSKRRNDD